jgi:electron transfer flavoprotein beta subunit
VNILVCLKQVPDTEATIKTGSGTNIIEEAGLKFIINPYDEFAIEEALRIKEAAGGTIKAITMGPERAKEALRTAVAMGVDDVLLLQSDQVQLDGLKSAQALAQAIANEKFDMILLGKESIDDGNMQVGPMLAELLNIPCVTVVTKLAVQAGSFTAEREGESGIEVLSGPTPCLITCQKGLNEPRYPSIRGVMMAKKKEIPVVKAAAMDSRVTVTELSYPTSRKGGQIVGEGAAAVPELVRRLREEAKVI